MGLRLPAIFDLGYYSSPETIVLWSYRRCVEILGSWKSIYGQARIYEPISGPRNSRRYIRLLFVKPQIYCKGLTMQFVCVLFEETVWHPSALHFKSVVFQKTHWPWPSWVASVRCWSQFVRKILSPATTRTHLHGYIDTSNMEEVIVRRSQGSWNYVTIQCQVWFALIIRSASFRPIFHLKASFSHVSAKVKVFISV